MWARPEARQTVAMLPVCVLPKAFILLSGATWCFGGSIAASQGARVTVQTISSADTAMLPKTVNVF